MSFPIHASWAPRLRSLPETGMGYQIVEVDIGKGVRTSAVVLNGQVALDARESALRLREEGELYKRSLGIVLHSAVEQQTFQVLTAKDARARGWIEKRAYSAREGPASDATPETSDPGEQFLRFSAFAQDIRILADGSVTEGTYVTTLADGLEVKSGKEAVERYALPNPDPAIHRFWLRPPDAIQLRRGVVQPAHGHQGGGAEAIFDNGAPRGTRYKQDTISTGD